MVDPSSTSRPIHRITGDARAVTEDRLAVEEPLEIRIAFTPPDAAERTVRPISVTMRTPGQNPDEDADLALGFLFTEGIITSPAQVQRTFHCGPETTPLRLHNVIRVELSADIPLDLSRLDRHFYTSSSCGICGKTSIDAIRTLCPAPLDDAFQIPAATLHALPEFLRAQQAVFDRTGGLHAAALFDAHGKLLTLREDVGRHNALDKIIGHHFRAGQLPARARLLLVSGRASFELLQKTIMAGIPIIAAVGAPSSLAVDLAQQFNITLVGFLRNGHFNIYTAPQRILDS